MKKFSLILFAAATMVLLQSCIVSRHPNIAFFDNPYYDFGNAKFTSVNVPVFLAKPFVKSALREDGESEEVVALVKSIRKIRMMTVENGDAALLRDFSKYLTGNHYEEWVTVKHNGQNVNIRALQNGDRIEKLMIVVSADGDLVFIDVKGKFTIKQISDLINSSAAASVASSAKDF